MNIENILNQISSHVWGPITLSLLLGVGIYLMFLLKGFPLLKINIGLQSLFN